MSFVQDCDDCYWAWCYCCEEWDTPVACDKHYEKDDEDAE